MDFLCLGALSARGGEGAWLGVLGKRTGFRRVQLGELPLEMMTQLRQVAPTPAPERMHLFLTAAQLVAHPLQELVRLGLRLTYNQLRLALRLRLDVGAQLLRTDQRFVERRIAIAKHLQLLVLVARLLLELLVGARQALQLSGHLLTELVNARPIVATEFAAKIKASRVERREMESFKAVVHHANSRMNQVRPPKSTVPRRTCVAPSSTATS